MLMLFWDLVPYTTRLPGVSSERQARTSQGSALSSTLSCQQHECTQWVDEWHHMSFINSIHVLCTCNTCFQDCLQARMQWCCEVPGQVWLGATWCQILYRAACMHKRTGIVSVWAQGPGPSSKARQTSKIKVKLMAGQGAPKQHRPGHCPTETKPSITKVVLRCRFLLQDCNRTTEVTQHCISANSPFLAPHVVHMCSLYRMRPL